MRGSKQFDYKQKKYNYLDQIFHSNDNNSLTHSRKMINYKRQTTKIIHVNIQLKSSNNNSQIKKI